MLNINFYRPIKIAGEETRYSVSTDGKVINNKTEREIKPHFDGKYLNARLTKNGKTKGYKIHRLVAIEFLDNPDDLKEVNHIDGNKRNNDMDNLEWVSASENCIHAVTHGLKPKTVKLTLDQVHYICKLIKSKAFKNKEIAKMVGCTIYDVKNIKSKIAWRFISKDYF